MQSALLAPGQLGVYPEPQVFPFQAVFWPVSPQHLLVHGLACSQVHSLVFLLVRALGVTLGCILQSTELPEGNHLTYQHSSQFCIICKLTEGGLFPWPLSSMSMLNRADPSINPWDRHIAGHCPAAGLCATGHKCLSPSAQKALILPYCAFVYSVRHQFISQRSGEADQCLVF